MFMVLLVLHNTDKLRDILDAWDNAGVPGVTIMHSTGIGKLRQHPSLWDDLPLLPRLEDFYKHEELLSRTLFSVVSDEPMVDKIVRATQSILGDLSQPETGLLVVLPLSRVYGLEKSSQESKQ